MKFTLLVFVVFAVCATMVAAQSAEVEIEELPMMVCPEMPRLPPVEVECLEGGDNEPMIEPTLAVCPESLPDIEPEEVIVPVKDLLDD